MQVQRTEPDPLIGKEPLGQYRILMKLGQGGFGSAYLAEQLGVERKAVIKVLDERMLDSNEGRARFEREAQVLASLDHHHIVRLYNFGALPDGRPFLAMEYGGDQTLEMEIRTGRLKPDRALLIAGQICEALQDAHDHGIVHRDMKPANVLLGRKGAQDWVKLVDVGIAHIVAARQSGGPRITQTGSIIGTPAYFSPEQARGLEVDGRSDIYSLGVSLCERLTGALPIRGPTPIDFVRAHCVDAPEPMARHGVRLPGYVEYFVFKALEKDPARRYGSADQMRQALAEARARLKTAPRAKRLEELFRSKRALAVVCGLGAIVALALAFTPSLMGTRTNSVLAGATDSRSLPPGSQPVANAASQPSEGQAEVTGQIEQASLTSRPSESKVLSTSATPPENRANPTNLQIRQDPQRRRREGGTAKGFKRGSPSAVSALREGGLDVKKSETQTGSREAEVAKSSVELRLTSEPLADFDVFWRRENQHGSESGRTPKVISVPRDSKVWIRFRRDGYLDADKQLVAGADESVSIPLAPVR